MDFYSSFLWSQGHPLGKISALERAVSFELCGANREEIAIENLFFLTC